MIGHSSDAALSLVFESHGYEPKVVGNAVRHGFKHGVCRSPNHYQDRL